MSMNTFYVVINNLHVQSANNDSSYCTNGFSASGVVGFNDAFKHYLNTLPRKESLFSVAEDNVDLAKRDGAFAIIHEYQALPGSRSFAGFLAKPRHQAINPPANAIKENLYDARLTLVLEVTTSLTMNELGAHCFDFLKTARFSGGYIRNLRKFLIASEKSVLDRHISILSSEERLEKRLKKSRGWVIAQATEAFMEEAKTDGVVDAIKNYLFTFITTVTTNDEGKKLRKPIKQYKKKHKGWYFLGLEGYRFLEDPSIKSLSRGEHPHVYAEPVIGLHQLEFFRGDSLSRLWRWNKTNEGLFLANNKCVHTTINKSEI